MNVEQMAVAEYWRGEGLQPQTANRLGTMGIDSIEKLGAMTERQFWGSGIGPKGKADIRVLVMRQQRGASEHMAFLEGFSDADLVMEMLRRGYRVDRPNGVTNS